MTRAALPLTLAASLAGCSPQPSAPPPQADDPSSPRVPNDAPAPVVARPAVPADVFFADPFAVLADDTPVPGAAPAVAASDPMRDANITGGPADAVAAEGGSSEPGEPAPVDWAALLSADALDDEVRAVLARLGDRTRDVGTYNNAYLQIPPDAAELAALFAVGGRMDRGPGWADRADQLAAKAAEITADPLRRGAAGFSQAGTPLKTLDALLNGGGRGAGGEPDSLADHTDFNLLMARSQAGTDKLQAIASSPQLLSANRDAAEREARVLAVLSAVTADPSHGWGEDEEFRVLSQAMTEAALAAAGAADDYDAFDAARRELGQTCSNCHGVYRN